MVVLYKRSKKTGEFSYKEMTETCGPSASRAPVRLIEALDKLAPIPADDARQSAQWALQWRNRCRENAKRKPARKFSPGQLVQFGSGRLFALISPAGPRLGWHVKLYGANGQIYRASARQMADCKLVDQDQFMRDNFEIVRIG
jgi:hypothetical protein